jgi:hypothetical protein
MAGVPGGTDTALVVMPVRQSAPRLAVVRIPRRYIPVLTMKAAQARRWSKRRDHRPLKHGSARRPMDLRRASRRLFAHHSIEGEI